MGMWRVIALSWIMAVPMMVSAQDKKEGPAKKSAGITSVTKRVKGLLYQNPGDTVMNQKSEQGFTRYQGKIIRTITINHIGFERDINDTTRYKVVNDVVRVANSFHSTTKERVIRNNLFIREGKPLDPYKLADNERYLRDLDFIVDARIIVKPVRRNRDQVDVVVYTRDVFSLGGRFSPSLSEVDFRIYDANVSGWGQRVEFNGLVNYDRSPGFGHQLLYSKNSIKGSFVNGTVSYTQLNNGASYGLENEHAVFVRLDRPLVSPYTRWAGGIQVSRNWSVNNYLVADTAFRRYSYQVKDFWIGYNIGIKNKMENRNRHFVGIRTFEQQFDKQPVQSIEAFSPVYNNRTYVLGEITFYNQNFYRTKYIYGFGRTEDLPYGRRLTFLAGRVKQLGLERPYVGVEYDKSYVHKRGDFRQFSLRAGGYKDDNDLQDVTVLASASYFSNLISWNKLGIRQSVTFHYTTILNHKIILPLRIDNQFGVENFNTDSLIGTKRLGIKLETTVFTKPTLLGFHFAPFIFADAALVAPEHASLLKQKVYAGLGGGIRTRNENLIFGTIELRFFYFPRVTEDISQFKVSLSSNLRVKYSSGFVSAPRFIDYN